MNGCTLNVRDALTIARILRACQGNERTRWVVGVGSVAEGIARHVCRDTNGNFLHDDDDVRNGFVRFSGMFETFMPMCEAMHLVETAHMVFGA